LGRFVGIDLGTTYSVVAYINDQGKAEVIPNEHGAFVTPSVVFLGGEMPVVGDVAKEEQEAGASEVASFFKRNMDDAHFMLSSHGRDYTAIDLSALVLAYLKKQAEKFFGEAVTDAVITVPAYFTHNQRTATIEAGRKAGLRVLKIISEPTSAALAYGLRPNASAREEKQVFLVYDLGGGTFDVSLVSVTPTELVVQATGGDHHLGGKDWDDRLLNYLATQFERDFQAQLLDDDINTLRVQSEKLKRSLSSKQHANISVQAAGYEKIYTITRELFEDLTMDLMERTRLLTEQVLQEASTAWSDLSGVLPVGGSTRMPMVTTFIQRMSGKPPMAGINADEAVGLGAAIQAAMEMEADLRLAAGPAPLYHLAGRKTTVDVIAHSLGLIAENADRSRFINSIIIPKNLPIPSTQMRPYQLGVRRKKTELEIFLTQGESEDPEHCSYLGRYVFSNFPPMNGKIAVLEITYEYDKNGIVHISALEQASRAPLTLTEYPVPADVPARFANRPTDLEVREPLTVYLAFDVSGSMHQRSNRGTPLDQARQAAEQFVKRCDLTNTSIGLIAFSSHVHVEQVATQNAKLITDAIRKLPSVKLGYGNEADPFDDILKCFTDVPGVCYAIVLADGRWVYQREAIIKARRCHETGIETIAVGFGGADRDFLDQIASSPEQSFFTDLDKLVETFTTIARELTVSGGERWSRPINS
jgi:molecular chaperone DnaK